MSNIFRAQSFHNDITLSRSMSLQSHQIVIVYIISVFMIFSKFYGDGAFHIQKFTAFCSAFTKVCEFGLNDVIYTYKCMKNFTPGFPCIQQIFINQIFYPCKWIKISPTWTKIYFRSSGLKKSHPGRRKNFFPSKITISLFLKIALFICIL